MRVRAAAASSRAELKFNIQSDVFRICRVIALNKYYLPKQLFLRERAFVHYDEIHKIKFSINTHIVVENMIMEVQVHTSDQSTSQM